MTPPYIVTVGEDRYQVLATTPLTVTYQPWRGDGWASPVTIVRAAWRELVRQEGPDHWVPAWTDGDRDSTRRVP